MSDTTNTPQSGDPLKDDVQKALLAAFGDDAMDWMDEDENLELEMQAFAQASDTAAEENSLAPDAKLGNLLEEISSALDGSSVAEGALESFGETENEDDEALVDLGPRYVVFEVGDQQYGMPLDGVLEIDRCGKVTSLPRTPNWLVA